MRDNEEELSATIESQLAANARDRIRILLEHGEATAEYARLEATAVELRAAMLAAWSRRRVVDDGLDW